MDSKILKRLIVFSLCLFFSAPVLAAFEIPDRPDNYITDRANLFSPEEAAPLNAFLRRQETKTGIQVAVGIFPSLSGESLEDLSIRIAEKWKIGDKKSDKGVLLLIFMEDHALRIEVGYGLEDRLTDALSGIIIREKIVPYFQKQEYATGILKGLHAILRATQEEPLEGGSGSSGRRRAPVDLAPFLRLITVIVLVVFSIDLFRYLRYRKGHAVYRGGYSFGGWWFRFAILFFLFQFLFRILFYMMLSGRGGYSSGSGGFSGGGGSFGGGGASGRW